MVSLKTVNKPIGGGAETAVATAAPHKINDGAKGSATDESSRAARSFVVHGKGEPLRPAGSSSPIGIESIILTDDRIRIADTDLFPWRMICALRMFSANGSSAIGSGWLAGPRTVVTAGHCVHDNRFFNGWADRIEVSPGRNAGDFPFGTVTSTNFASVGRWVNDEDPDFDIGVIHLDDPIGDATGIFGFASMADAELRDHFINVAGYPADRGNGTELYFHANRILHAGNRRIFYDADTFGGQSGCPVWIQDAPGAPPIVVGIHAYGTGGTPFDLGIRANSAPRIIPEVFDQIMQWIDGENGT